MRFPFIALFGLALSACSASVDYGKVRHSQFVADPRCNPVEPTGNSFAVDALFVATTRLPDCRAPDLVLTSFRSEQMRFGRFGQPEERKKSKIVPLAFQSEVSWWSDLRNEAERANGRVLVYVHGYRETFFTSSRDTFQIAKLTDFKGPVVEYSWPSQGDFIRYVVDETNMYWDERNFRRFLQKLAQQPWTKEIVLVSHSLGARLVIPAVEYVDANSNSADSSNISNIILASPDIDREDFERDIVEEVLSTRRVNNDRRITVYASANDKALALSRGLHGFPRLGSPYCFDPFEPAEPKADGPTGRCYAAKGKYAVAPEKSGFTIVDTTDATRGNSGHSDFLRSASACLDFKAVANGDRNGSSARMPTHLAHVFTLKHPSEAPKNHDVANCKLPPDD
jgi:pimeloyl-ACP methyl ester carboxylesterase